MLKKSASGVLGPLSGSRTTVVRSARQGTCGLAGPGFAIAASHRRAGLFEHPVCTVDGLEA